MEQRRIDKRTPCIALGYDNTLSCCLRLIDETKLWIRHGNPSLLLMFIKGSRANSLSRSTVITIIFKPFVYFDSTASQVQKNQLLMIFCFKQKFCLTVKITRGKKDLQIKFLHFIQQKLNCRFSIAFSITHQFPILTMSLETSPESVSTPHLMI